MPTACMISRVSVSARRLLPSSVLKRTEEPIARSYSLRNAASAFWAWVVAWAVLRSASLFQRRLGCALSNCQGLGLGRCLRQFGAQAVNLLGGLLQCSPQVGRLALQGLEVLDRPLLGGERLKRLRGLQSTFLEVALQDISDPVQRLSEHLGIRRALDGGFDVVFDLGVCHFG